MRARVTRFTAVSQAFLLTLTLVLPGLVAAGEAPSISSDLVDYAPGSIVTLTGADWDVAEAVHVAVNDDEGQTWSYAADAVADESGSFTVVFQLPDWFVATYYVTASGATSGTATTTFADSNLGTVVSTTTAEGNATSHVVNVSVTMTGNSTPIPLFARTQNGTATGGAGPSCAAGNDFITIPSGSIGSRGAGFTIPVTICEDPTAETNEQFTLQVADNAGFLNGGGNNTATGTITITNDDNSASITNVSQAEGNSNTTMTFQVSLNNVVAAGGSIKVGWATAPNGSATNAGSCSGSTDYQNASGTLTFAAGSAGPQNVVVTICGDTALESNETFLVNLTADATTNTAVVIGTSPGTGTIQNDDSGTVVVSTVVKNAATNATVAGPLALGSGAYDTATITPSPSGFNVDGINIVRYNWFLNGTCAGSPSTTELVSVSSGAVGNSSNHLNLGAGSYSFRADYLGNANYAAVNGVCEPFSVSTGTVAISTVVKNAADNSVVVATLPYGSGAYDTATITPSPSGFNVDGINIVRYNWFLNGTCAGSPSTTELVSVSSGAVGNSSNHLNLGAGSYSFRADYLGNANYAAVNGVCEPFSVSTGATTTTGSTSGSPILIGGSFTVSYTTSASLGVVGNIATGNVSVVKTGGPAGSLGCTPGSIALSQAQTAAGFSQSGTNVFTCTPAGDGTYTFVVRFTDTDGNYSNSDSTTITMVVEAQHSTSLSQQLVPNPAIYGQTVLVSGTLTDTTAGAAIVNVNVSDDSANQNCNGTSTSVGVDQTDGFGGYLLGYRPLATGKEGLQAHYAGDTGHAAADSVCIELNTNEAPTSIVNQALSSSSIGSGGSTLVSYKVQSAYGIGLAGHNATGNVSIVSNSGPGTLTCTPNSTSFSVAETNGDGTGAADAGFSFSANAGTNPASRFSCSATVAGTYVFHLHYGGEVDYLASDSATMTLTVDAAPTVTSTTPANGASGVATNAAITLNFSEPVNVTFITVSCTTSGLHTFSKTGDGTASVTFTPAVAYAQTETCTVTVNAAVVTDVDTNDPPDTMAANYVFSFTTIDPAPTVTATSPLNGATGVLVGSNITVTFSEPVSASTSPHWFTLVCGVAQTGATTGSGTSTITFDPAANLPSGTLCNVTVNAAGITDVDTIDPPNNMAANYLFSFTTAVSNTPPILTVPASPVLAEATSPAGAVVTFTVTATDAEDNPDPTPTCNHNSGNTFPLGDTTVNCSVTDSGGMSDSDSFVVRVQDTTDPTVDITTAESNNGFGWFNIASNDLVAGVTVDIATSDAVGVTSLTCTVNAVSQGALDATGDSLVLGDGEHFVQCTATDGAGNDASDSAPFSIDQTAPSIDIDHTADGSNGWNVTDPVTESIVASDATSGVDFDAVACLDGASSLAVTFDDPDWSASVTGDGIHNLSCTATDGAGNTKADTDQVKIDTVDPTIDISHVADGDNGWNVTNPVTESIATTGGAVSVACLDGASPLATTGAAPTWSASVSGQGEHALSCTATDAAGNTSDPDTDTVKIDTVAPTFTHTLTPASPAGTGWYNIATGAPVMAFSCSDGTSGLASACPGNFTFGNGANQSHSATIYDKAGNSSSESETGIDVDLIAPSISAALSPAADAVTGWWNLATGAPTVTYTCGDTGSSGLASCTSPYLFGEGADQTHSGTATDVAGNSNTAGVSNVDVDLTAPSSSAAVTPVRPASGWWNIASGAPTVTYTCGDAGSSGLASCKAGHASLTNAYTFLEGENQLDTGTAKDVAGNTNTATVTNIDVDLTAPTFTHTLTPASPDTTGWYNLVTGVPTMAFTCSDGTSGLAALCPSDFTFGQGANQSHSETIFDNAGNSSSQSESAIYVDTVRPTIDISHNADGNAGWNVTDPVAEEITASDATSGVHSIDCLDGVATLATSFDDPDWSASVTGEGIHSLSCTSTDKAGNTSVADTDSVKIDTVKPTISPAVTPSRPASGWWNIASGAPTVTYTCLDTGGSGVASCLAGHSSITNAHTFAEGADQTDTGTATDVAGNTNTAGVSDIDVDLTAPSISHTLTPASPAATGWYNIATGAPTMAFTCSDALSGLAAACPADFTFGNGASQSHFETIYDNAGNSASTSRSGINVDLIAPSISAALSPAADAVTGWYNIATGAPTGTYTCGDTGSSGLASCTSPHLFGEGADQIHSGTATDVAGNSNTAGVSNVDVDLTAPSISAALSPAADAVTGWYNIGTGAPTVTYTCGDTGSSGLASCKAGHGSLTNAYTFGEGADQTDTGTAKDVAGNSNIAGVSNVDVDLTAPSISAALTPAAAGTGWWNIATGAPTVTYTCGDTGSSGLASCKAGHSSLTNAYTFGEGADQTDTGTAKDVAGNSNTAGASNVDVDLTAPVVTVAVSAGTAGAHGWYTSNVTVDTSGSDLTSGVSDSNCTVNQNQLTDTTGTSFSGQCTDNAGNVGNGGPLVVKLDKVNPSVAITSPATGYITVASSINVSGTDSDATSGIDTVKVNGFTAGLGTNTFSYLVLPLSCGVNTITAVATDMAGRTNNSSITVTRVCNAGLQYYSPIDQSVAATPIINTGKMGRVIPVKITASINLGSGAVNLTDTVAAANGLSIKIGVNLSNCTNTAQTDDVEAYADAGAANGNTPLFRWTSPQWIYNLDTGKAPSVTMTINSCYRLDVYLLDSHGSQILLSSGPGTGVPYAIFKPTK